ncbi:MAG: alpha/beta fold hydrolase [Acidobacteriota bacterium]|nr:alpha/beta fold hydrolase [Acidobacteriota bacterium]
MKRLFVAVFLSCLLAIAAAAQDAKVENGSINGAAFRIELPAAGVKGLVMYCHGYQTVGSANNFENARAQALRKEFLSRGFAFAESAYSTQGWAVKEAVEDTEALRRYFVGKHGKPNETIVLGHSMGGAISLATIEKYPEVYDGALPMCGPLNVTLNGFQERIFDMLVTFDFLFPNVVGSLTQLPQTAKLDQAKARTAIEAAPDKAARYAKRYSLNSSAELPFVLAFWYEIIRELQFRSGGNPFDNRNTIYDGFEDDVAMNRGVKRYAADAKAREYLRQHYSPTGKIADPVLTLHTTYDQLIPGRFVSQYDEFARVAGTQDLFVAKFVVANGHCNFTAPQTGAAFDELLAWIRDKKRPAAGEIK